MKVLHVVAGAGGMYCGSCLHGNTLAAALERAGCDAILVPAYTPIRTDEQNVSIDRVVYGGVNVYLQQASAVFRHTPRVLDRLLDRPALLRRLGRRGSTTRPAQLGTPVVAAGHGAFPELIEDTGGGLLHAPHDAPALAAALEQLIQDPQHAAECARRGHQSVHQRYGAAQMAQRTMELYEKVCAAENAPDAHC